MSSAKIVWATPDAENVMAYCARVSNPKNQDNVATSGKLLKYCLKHKHFSVFETANVCLEITTTRDIARQILRHRSFSFQEFSQRYAEADSWEFSECRMQDEDNRQSSLETEDRDLTRWWADEQGSVLWHVKNVYTAALKLGIAKEVARKVLPEGMTNSTMYMNGTIRSWLHYIEVRTDEATQKEHRIVANLIKAQIAKVVPNIMEELDKNHGH